MLFTRPTCSQWQLLYMYLREHDTKIYVLASPSLPLLLRNTVRPVLGSVLRCRHAWITELFRHAWITELFVFHLGMVMEETALHSYWLGCMAFKIVIASSSKIINWNKFKNNSKITLHVNDVKMLFLYRKHDVYTWSNNTELFILFHKENVCAISSGKLMSDWWVNGNFDFCSILMNLPFSSQSQWHHRYWWSRLILWKALWWDGET